MKTDKSTLSYNTRNQSIKCVVTKHNYVEKAVPVFYSMFNNISVCLTSISRELGLDVVDTLIYVTVAATNLEPLSLSGAIVQCDLVEDHGEISIYRPILQSSLARSIGLPRQTVRRRIKRLAAAGWLVQSQDGVRIGRTRDKTVVKADLAVTLLNVVCRSINQMVDADVIAMQNS